jgi:hypothetical protein
MKNEKIFGVVGIILLISALGYISYELLILKDPPIWKEVTVEVTYTDACTEIYDTGLLYHYSQSDVSEMCTIGLRDNRCGVRAVKILKYHVEEEAPKEIN